MRRSTIASRARLLTLLVAPLAGVFPLRAQYMGPPITGSWVGNYSYSGGRCKFQTSGFIGWTINKNDDTNFSGTAYIDNIQWRDSTTCQVSG